MEQKTTHQPGSIVSDSGGKIYLTATAPATYRGRPMPAGALAFHRWIKSRNAFTTTASFYRDADDARYTPTTDPRKGA